MSERWISFAEAVAIAALRLKIGDAAPALEGAVKRRAVAVQGKIVNHNLRIGMQSLGYVPDLDPDRYARRIIDAREVELSSLDVWLSEMVGEGAASQSTQEPATSDGRGEDAAHTSEKTRPASKSSLVKDALAVLHEAQRKKIVALTKGEMTDLLRGAREGTSREQVRTALQDGRLVSKFSGKTGPKSARNPNRSKELDELRCFLTRA